MIRVGTTRPPLAYEGGALHSRDEFHRPLDRRPPDRGVRYGAVHRAATAFAVVTAREFLVSGIAKPPVAVLTATQYATPPGGRADFRYAGLP